ncbi:methylated-DNA--[protein]-cysteine S-methyltransferase [Paenibacillus gorillae]|uniref:methylated-DNA--[protein]-cysteine S-methyltransferase n=1 Tax=Paenibacillus gorillae TaxID=1243662 RepID=UPI0004B88FF8|nr:methylated-DNA--[protein]-cysteine S-methyltransferase [Paenibacillus gorillae]
MEQANERIIYWAFLIHGQWRLYVAATPDGLCYVGSPGKPYKEMSESVSRRYPRHEWEQSDDRVQPYMLQLKQYMDGDRREFTIPFDSGGTPFQSAVWEALRHIPYGRTCSYSDIAEQIGKPSSVRAVGTAIGANPILITVPCHRVIGKNGTLTGYRGGLEMKTELLRLERESLLADRSVQYV